MSALSLSLWPKVSQDLPVYQGHNFKIGVLAKMCPL